MIWNFDEYQENTALLDEFGTTLTYAELKASGEKIAAGIGRRCLVFSFCENSIGSVLGYTAFVNNGIVPVLLNSHMDRELLGELIAKYKPSYFWAPVSQESDFERYQVTKTLEMYGYALLRTSFENEYPLYQDLCLLLTTSGSTGSPKFVRQSYANVLSNASAIVEYLQLDESERPITTLPMNYTYGLSIINSHLLVGATLLLTDKGLMQKEFWSFFKEQEATSFGGVPYTY